MKEWKETLGTDHVRPSAWPSDCDRNVCRLFIKFGMADLFGRNCEAILTLVPTGPATASLCSGQKEGLRYSPHFPTDLDEIRYRYLHKAIEPLWVSWKSVRRRLYFLGVREVTSTLLYRETECYSESKESLAGAIFVLSFAVLLELAMVQAVRLVP
jgi:hypothetical protein